MSWDAIITTIVQPTLHIGLLVAVVVVIQKIQDINDRLERVEKTIDRAIGKDGNG